MDGPTSSLCPDTPIGIEVLSSRYNEIIRHASTGNVSDADFFDVNEENKSTAIDKYKDLVRNTISGIDFNERVDYNTAHVDWDDFTDRYEDDTGRVSNDDIVYHNGCILQGDILQVEYHDPTDASGQPNSVTDSATFDLRNGVLQSDKSVYYHRI